MVLFVRCFKCKVLPLHFGKAFRILIIISPKKRKKWSRFITISTLSLLPAYSISWKTNSCYTFENRDLIFSTFQSLAKRVIGESLGRLAVGRLVTRNFGWWKIDWISDFWAFLPRPNLITAPALSHSAPAHLRPTDRPTHWKTDGRIEMRERI